MRLVSRRELLADLVVVFALPLMGCGGESEALKPAPEGAPVVTSQPKTQREAYEQNEVRAKELRDAAKAKKR
jgi:hypothetical protein